MYISVQLLYSSALWLLLGTFLCFLFVEVLSVFIHSSPELSESEYLYDILNSFSVMLFISILLKSFSDVLSCFLIFWNTFLFSHFVDCFHFHRLGEMATSISLIGMAIFRCWCFLSYLAIALGCLLKPCDYLNCLIYFCLECAKTCHYPKGKNLIYHIVSCWLEARA